MIIQESFECYQKTWKTGKHVDMNFFIKGNALKGKCDAAWSDLLEWSG